MEDINNNFTMVSEEEMVAVNGGGWNEFGKALTGTLLIAGGVIVCAVPVPGAPAAGAGIVVLGATGVASCCK